MFDFFRAPFAASPFAALGGLAPQSPDMAGFSPVGISKSAQVFRNYLIRKNGAPFLVVNATIERAEAVFAGFVRSCDGAWEMDAQI